MKKYLIPSLIALTLSGIASAQTMPARNTPAQPNITEVYNSPNNPDSNSRPRPKMDNDPDHFAHFKSEMLARLQKEQSCLQAANDMEAARACRPPRPMDSMPSKM